MQLANLFTEHLLRARIWWYELALTQIDPTHPDVPEIIIKLLELYDQRDLLKGSIMNTNIPKATIKGLTFWPIPEFDGPTQAFGAGHKDYFSRRDLPDVPKKYEDAINNLFFNGGKLNGLAPNVDEKKAYAAMCSWISSFAPAHEEKIATAAYALWVWSTPEALVSEIKEKA